MKVLFSVRSCTGNKKENNEDNLYADGLILLPEYCNRLYSAEGCADIPSIFAVFDGVGGMEDGEVASHIAAAKLTEYKEIIRDSTFNNLPIVIQKYINAIHEEISSTVKRGGTTLALAVVTSKGIHCFNVGDSRIYFLKGNSFFRITNDHTKGAELAGKQKITIEKARDCPDGNKLTRCIGYGKNYQADSYKIMSDNCRLLICSDGLSDMISDKEIRSILRNKLISDCADKLMNTAIKNGGKDNITFVVTDILPYSIKDHFIEIMKKWR